MFLYYPAYRSYRLGELGTEMTGEIAMNSLAITTAAFAKECRSVSHFSDAFAGEFPVGSSAWSRRRLRKTGSLWRPVSNAALGVSPRSGLRARA